MIMRKNLFGHLVLIALTAAALFMGAVEAAEPTTAPAMVQANITGYKFDPGVITVAVGTTITWTNQDDVPHTVTSTDKHFKSSGALDKGDSYSYTFTTAGTYPYYCTVHPFMTGKVIVQNNSGG
jgi:amicyanin